MASYIDDEIEGTLGGGPTEGGNLMGATSLDMTQAPSRRAATSVATATATEADIDHRAEALAQQQLGIESSRERTARVRALTEVFQQSLAALPGVVQQLDVLQQSAAAICTGSAPPPHKEGRLPVSSGLSPRLLLPVADLVSLTDFTFYAHPIISHPCAALPALEAAVAEEWKARGALGPPPRVGVSGWLGTDHVTPRGLSSSKLNRLVCVEGVVNRCSVVHPKLQRAVYLTESVLQQPPQGAGGAPEGALPDPEREVHLRSFFDATDLDKDIRDAQPPPEKDPEGRKVNRQEVGYCQYENHQKFYIQEAPETSPTGQLPRWVEVAAEGDLCDSIKCGDRVRVYGVYRPRAGPVNNQTSGYVRPLLVANNIEVLSAAARASMLQSVPADLLNLKAFASRKDLLQVLSRSLAPAVCGHETIKRGLMLMLSGGSERRSQTGHRVRGDIHVLLVGDPSAGKSQLLRFVLGLVPGAVSATGRGSSGVGLTAAVVADPDTGERRVEGGAMVLADRSIVCIDEFDKMQHSDRVAIHEVMEQQTVTVAKAGIHTTLNARCSVLAAANPLYGCWSSDLSFRSQLAFEDSLMTRFDLIFIVRDATTSEEDDRLAEAVLRNVTEKAKPAAAATAAEERRNQADGFIQPQGDMHKQSNPSRTDTQQEEQEPTRAFYRRNEMLYYDKQGHEHECLTHEFLRKYIALVRSGGLTDNEQQQPQEQQLEGPQLSDDAAAALVEFYGEIRQRAHQQKKGGSEEGVAASLMQAVTEDVRVSKQLLLFSLFGEALGGDSGCAGSGSEGESSDAQEESDDDESDADEDDIPVRRTTAADRALRWAPSSALAGIARGLREDGTTASAKDARTAADVPSRTATEDEVASQFEGLGLAESKKRRTRRAVDPQERQGALQALHAQGLSGDVLHSLITNCLKELDEGSGVSEAALLKAVAARAETRNLRAPTAEEFTTALQELNSKDSAPILVHDGLVYEC
ncbi:DNA replication licensing factor MCM3-like [Cyclospora cayetanensis]|uniref:DNA replication licensing factor MCM3-like n=1 Tax=Cyclospora cayetanensis TaxID=88456 RepID=A0A6P6RUX0_9EIME|nr:DNA replication licensing factor MCM3-like [Cyclospora cayetanensis]